MKLQALAIVLCSALPAAAQTDPSCVPPLGTRAPAIFLTELEKTTNLPGSRARLNFQVAAPDPITRMSVQVDGLDDPRSVMSGAQIAAVGGIWFTTPAPGPHYIALSISTSFGCTLTRAWPDPLVVLGDVAPVVVPAVPTNIVVMPGDKSVQLTWDAVANAATYVVYVSKDITGAYGIAKSDLTAPKFVDESLTNDMTYFYKVAAASSTVTGLASPPVVARPHAPVVDTGGLPTRLLQQDDLVLQGMFRLPQVNNDAGTYAYAAAGLAYCDARRSLFVNGHVTKGPTGEVEAIDPVMASSLDMLPTAPVKQDARPVFTRELIGGDVWLGGLLCSDDALIATGFIRYDAGGTARTSHFKASLDMAMVNGPYSVGPPERAGFVAGYMGWIPQAWRAALGGPAFTGQCCLSIISRTSLSATFIVFNPADLGVKNPAPSFELAWTHEGDHMNLGPWHGDIGANGAVVNGLTFIGGAAFPDKTASVLFLARVGAGRFCYGFGTDDLAKDGTQVPGQPVGLPYCYDPVNPPDKGQHGYPYGLQVFAYSAFDLARVKRGELQPWEVRPYAIWPLKVPFQNQMPEIKGVAWDKARERIYVSVGRSDYPQPLIYVYTIKAAP